MRTGQSIELEETYSQPDGKVEYFQVVKSAVFGPDGQIVGSQGIQFEITQRRQAEAALRESEQRFVQFMRNLSGLVYIKDLEGHYVFVNDAYERTFGIPVADWLGKTSDEFFPAGGIGQRRLNEARTLAERQSLVTTEEVSTKAGLRFFNTIEFPIVRPEESLLIGGISMDVTEIKQAQDEVQKLNANLELRVRERTAELEAVNRELEAFSYSVSHDLRAPLRAIDGFARILVDEHASALSVEGHRVLNVVMRESQRMGRLIDDLLAFSRLGRQALQPVEIDLAALVSEVYREQAAQSPGRKIQLQVTALPRANADPALMRQVLVNLVDNAIKYTRRRDLAQIEVGGSVRGSENVYYVKDNGAGFDPRYADKLFGVFQRLHTEAEFEGTGVGLALVQRIINRHGGRVWAEAQVDQGATFYFTLPSRRS
jgi:PAS domain S-box-containing protein